MLLAKCQLSAPSLQAACLSPRLMCCHVAPGQILLNGIEGHGGVLTARLCYLMQKGQDQQFLVKNILSKAQEQSGDRPLFERLKSMRLSSLKAIKHGDAGKLHAVVGPCTLCSWRACSAASAFSPTPAPSYAQ